MKSEWEHGSHHSSRGALQGDVQRLERGKKKGFWLGKLWVKVDFSQYPSWDVERVGLFFMVHQWKVLLYFNLYFKFENNETTLPFPCVQGVGGRCPDTFRCTHWKLKSALLWQPSLVSQVFLYRNKDLIWNRNSAHRHHKLLVGPGGLQECVRVWLMKQWYFAKTACSVTMKVCALAPWGGLFRYLGVSGEMGKRAPRKD